MKARNGEKQRIKQGASIMSNDILQEKIRQAGSQGRKALIPYLPAGFPDLDAFWDEIHILDQAGADIIEIGVPFTDPVADGPVVEEAAQDCLDRGVNLNWILDGLCTRKGKLQAGLVLMGYVNPFMQYGWQKLARDAAQAGVHGIIVPDLPLEENKEIESLLSAQKITLISLVGLNTSQDRMQAYAQRAKGFVYFVSVLGTTGTRSALPPILVRQLCQAREIFSQPVALGFGLSSPEQLQGLENKVDAVVFGSALIQHLRSGGHSQDFLSRWLS
jgi:tryptophan synthase alpha chain